MPKTDIHTPDCSEQTGNDRNIAFTGIFPTMSCIREDGRKAGELRKLTITRDFQLHPAGSVLACFGNTRVICAASVSETVPAWMRTQNIPGGWLTAEYEMLPGATNTRSARDAAKGKRSGRSLEIQRLIGRSLRAVVDLQKLGNCTLQVDCDVLDDDGGTRCTAITGACVAVEIALRKLLAASVISEWPMHQRVAAVSAGIVNGEPLLDLCYGEDSTADMDMNVVMTEDGGIVEVQGTAEGTPFTRQQLDTVLDMAHNGLQDVFALQKRTVEL